MLILGWEDDHCYAVDFGGASIQYVGTAGNARVTYATMNGDADFLRRDTQMALRACWANGLSGSS